MLDKIYKISANGNEGTAVLLDTTENEIGIIITAKHNLEMINAENYNDIVFNNAPNIEVIWMLKVEEYDVSFLICKNISIQTERWEIGDLVESSSEAKVNGFPGMKGSNFEYDFCNIKCNKNKNLYIGEMQGDIGDDKSSLMQGMSGAPVYKENVLYGIYLGSTEKNYNYNENRILPIQIILQEAKKNNLIYFKEFSFNCGIGIFDSKQYFKTDFPLDLEKYNKLEFLLIGKSGNGKSAFIRTFLKNADKIASTGKGRTTRFSCEYRIHYRGYKKENSKIEIHFLERKDFISRRNNKKIVETIKEGCKAADLLEMLVYEKGFFDIEELDDKYVNEADNIFAEVFNVTDKEQTIIVNEEDDEKKNNFADRQVELFFGKLYDFVSKSLFIEKIKTIELGDKMSEQDINFIKKCFKGVNEDGTSSQGEKTYSGWIKKIVIEDRVCDEYCDIFEKYNLQSVLFIDTYGLDHISDDNKEIVTERLKNLVFNDYPKVKKVLYVRKMSTDAPNDLEFYLPTIYDIDASLILNVIFTHIDEDNSFKLEYDKNNNVNLIQLNDSLENRNASISYFQEKKTYSKFRNITHPLKKKIAEVVKSDLYAESIFNSVIKRLTPYCASEEKKEYEYYFKNNYIKIDELFNATFNKEYKGDGIIDIGKYDGDSSVSIKFQEQFQIMFERAKMKWGIGIKHRENWKTKKSNVEYIQNNILGYNGRNDDQWSSQFKTAYNDAFSKIDDEVFEKIFHSSRDTKSGVAIQSIINEFKKDILGCKVYNRDSFLTDNSLCEKCEEKDSCFKTMILRTYKENELSEEIKDDEDSKDWLNNRCNFDQRYRDNSEMFDNFLKSKWSLLLNQFVEHNKDIVEKKLCNNESIIYQIHELKKNVKKHFPELVNVDDKYLYEVMYKISKR